METDLPYGYNYHSKIAEILDFFQYFGHYIIKLKIDYDLFVDREFMEQIRKQIEKYVAEFVDKSTFIAHYKNTLADL